VTQDSPRLNTRAAKLQISGIPFETLPLCTKRLNIHWRGDREPVSWMSTPTASRRTLFTPTLWMFNQLIQSRAASAGGPGRDLLVTVHSRGTWSQAAAPTQADEGLKRSAQHGCERVLYSQRRMWHFLSLLPPMPAFMPVRCGLTTFESSKKTGWGMLHLCPENCTKWTDENLMRSFSDIQAPLLIIQMFDFFLQYAVRINALWRWYRNFSFQKRKKPQILEQKSHLGIWHYSVSFYPPDSLNWWLAQALHWDFSTERSFAANL